MTKEEYIKSVWGEHWDIFSIKTHNQILRDNGILDCFLIDGDLTDKINSIKGLKCFGYDEGTERYFTFESLIGVGNNFGWKRITPKTRIPSEDVWVTNYHGNRQVFFSDAFEPIDETYTHYQEINKPKNIGYE